MTDLTNAELCELWEELEDEGPWDRLDIVFGMAKRTAATQERLAYFMDTLTGIGEELDCLVATAKECPLCKSEPANDHWARCPIAWLWNLIAEVEAEVRDD